LNVTVGRAEVGLTMLGEGAAPRFLQPAVGLLDERGHVAGA
jgi:hypothetical protein